MNKKYKLILVMDATGINLPILEITHFHRFCEKWYSFRQEDFLKFSSQKSMFSLCDLDMQRTITI